jgi:hypothetical protein
LLGHIETRAGVKTFSHSQVLSDQLTSLDKGTLVRITFTEWKTSKAGRRYRGFDVDIAKDAGNA